MPQPRVYHHKVFEGVDLEPLDRFVGRDNVSVVASELDSIDIRIFDDLAVLVYEETAIAPGNGITGPIYDTLQLDGRWRYGPPGYNFRRLVTNAAIIAQTTTALKPGHTYRLEVALASGTHGPMYSVHEYEVLPIRSRPTP